MPFVLAPSDPVPTPEQQAAMRAVERWLRRIDATTNFLPAQIDVDKPLFDPPTDGYGLSRAKADDDVHLLDGFLRWRRPAGEGFERRKITARQLHRHLNGVLVINTSRDLIRLCLN